MNPTLSFLDNKHLLKTIEQAKRILCEVGLDIEDRSVISLMVDHGATYSETKKRLLLTESLISKHLNCAPSSFKLFDTNGIETNDFSNNKLHFTPASSALRIVDYNSIEPREAVTEDYINFVKVVAGLNNIESQSTAFITTDVEQKISDSYRLFLNLLYGTKPVVTGTFSKASFSVMNDMLQVFRGSSKALKEKPLALFTACPVSPLKWSSPFTQTVRDCSEAGIPMEIVSMPLAGFTAPVSLEGILMQHTAEIISGIVLSQIYAPGSPVMFGTAAASFDIRYETTPGGAVESMMIGCAVAEIGKYLNIPTQAYIALSDAKTMDAQAGFESGMGATMASLSGINNVSGPGALDFINCQSLEKLVFDNEICGMTQRAKKGINSEQNFPTIELMDELLEENHLIIAKHTRRNLRKEHYFPGPVIDRMGRSRWQEEGARKIMQRAHDEVRRLISEHDEPHKSSEQINDLVSIMENEAKRVGQSSLPKRN